MAVIAKFVYEVKPGRLEEFMAKLGQAAEPRFNSPVMPRSVRTFKSTLTGLVTMLIEYEDEAAYEARTAFERSNDDWKTLFEINRESPERLVSVELLTEL